MKRSLLLALNLAMVIVMTLAPLSAAAPAPDAQNAPASAEKLLPPPPNRAKDISPEGQVVEQDSPEAALSKLEPALREAALKGSSEIVELYVSVRPGIDLSKYLSRMIVRPVVFGGVQNVYGQTSASNLLAIAQQSGVVALVATGGAMRDKPFDPEPKTAPSQAQLQERVAELRANELTFEQAQQKANDVGAKGWFDVLDGHKSSEAWKKGFTGQGVIVGVLDDGVDFAHPDLQGTYAWVTDPASPYFGWPMAFSQVSTKYFADEVKYQNLGAYGITLGWNGSRWSDTNTVVPGQLVPANPTKRQVNYKPVGSSTTHTYMVPRTSQSNLYKLGTLHEKNLLATYGERVAVVVIDEHVAGTYDTVYVDLDHDFDFTDEKPVTKSSPEVYRDMNGDGYADISGGLLVWVSDGANVPPTTDWLWGIHCGMEVGTLKACPASGSLVIFSGPFDAGYTHGTQCASNVAGQGVVNGGLTAQPFRVGGMVQGGAPDVGVMDFGNHYYAGTDEDEFIVAALGYDGVAGSGDEVQITSNSYGSFTQMWGSWGYIGRLVTALNLTVAPNTVWVFSGGNEGPGYGPQEGEAGPTIIKAGTSTQYGSTNWDSILSAKQIVYGDPSSFGAKGPNRDGSSGLDILGNGGRGAGDEGLNYYGYNGAESWATWGGTSRSAPVVAGNLALLYQAYKARHGMWPTWDEVLAILKSSATNSVSSPFFQGAGVVNSDRSTDVAAGLYGVYATPDEWQVGDWQGVEYLNFAKLAKPGSTYTKTYTVNNPSGYNITVGLTDGYMGLITKTQYTFTTSDESLESAYNFHSPDYLMALPKSIIPTDAEVMIVRYVHPYSSYDPNYDYSTANSSWRMMMYNWTDQNKDGKLWVDANNNGVVNHANSAQVDNDGFARLDFANTEIQEGEYVRMDYEFGGLSIPLIVHDPLERMADGYFFGFQHRNNDHTVKTTTFQIGVEFYKRADWPWVSLSAGSLAVPANGAATFDAVAAIPANAKPGIYEGVIYMKDPGDGMHAMHESALPVVVNVMADLPNNGSVTFGNTPMANTMYQNSWTNGYFNWYGGGWTGAGDWRHYFLNLDSTDVSNKNLLVHTSWTYTPTDFNTWVLGPTNDCASNGAGTCAWYEPGLGQPDPSVYGPYTLQPIGSSSPFLSGATYPFQTSTGGPNDWLKVPLTREGLHELALHNVLYAGKDLAEQFKVDVGTLKFDATMDPAAGKITLGSINVNAYTSTGTVDLLFTPTLGVPDLNASLAGGLSVVRYNQPAVLVRPNGGVFSAWDSDNTVVPFQLTRTDATQLKVHLIMPAAQDIDFFVVRDVNNNGLAEQGVDVQVGSSGNGTGADEEVTLVNPVAAQYLAVMAGYAVDPPTGVNAAWWYQVTAPGEVPAEPLTVFSNTVSISQTAFVTSTNTYTMVVTADERAAALYASLSGFTSTANLDLYVSDSNGAIVASSTTTGTSEMVTVKPAAGQYRFVAGAKYTIWVHGKSVPTPPAAANLKVWWDHLNMWLTAVDPDVHVNAINPGEMVSVTLHFDKPNWNVGDPDISARLLANMSVLPNAFDELVTLHRANPPVGAFNAVASKNGGSVRGTYPITTASPYGYPDGRLVLVAPGEEITYTVRVTNTGTGAGVVGIDDYWGDSRFAFARFVVTPTYYSTYLASGWRGLYVTQTLNPGEAVEFSYVNVLSTNLTLNSYYSNYVDVYDDSTASMFPYSQGAWAGALYRGFSNSTTTGFAALTTKKSIPSAVMPGDTFTYRLSLLNPSSVSQAIKVTDTLPSGVTYVSNNFGGTYDAGSNTVYVSVTVPGTSIAPTVLDIVVTMNPGVAAGTVVQNSASFYNGLTNALLTTKTANTTVLPSANLELNKAADKLTGKRGDTVKYTLVFRNTGPLAASSAKLVDMVPWQLDPVGATITATKASAVAFWNAAAHTINWQGNLAAGEVVTLTYDAQINASASVDLALINLAKISAPSAMTTVYDSAVTEVIFGYKIYLPVVIR